jgi:glycosyltransferase involved in cell wall biosynthesis
VGGFLDSPSPNEDAMIHFTRKIFPSIHERLGCHLIIAGTNYLDSIRDLQSDTVTVTGYVEELKEYYEKSRIFVVPTRFAAGISLKLLEAMAHGLPSVVTPLIARQLDLKEGQGILIGKDDQDFSSKTVDLYHNRELWHALQKGALDFIRSRFNPETMKLRLATFFRSFDFS